MSNIAPLLDRNRAFASNPGARQNMPRLPFIPNLNLYIVTCIDCRVDPAQILGVRLGEALVQRNIGGRITPAIIADIAYAGYLVDAKAPEGPYFEVAIVHHTDCGSTLLADDELRHGFAQRIGTDERTLADTPVLDPARTVQTDVNRVLWAEEIPQNVRVSGHVYDVNTGIVTTVVDAKGRKLRAGDARSLLWTTSASSPARLNRTVRLLMLRRRPLQSQHLVRYNTVGTELGRSP